MNELQVFNNEDFGEVRTIVIDNEPYFVAKDITDRLGFSNGRDAILNHVDEDDRANVAISDGSQDRRMTVINESGLFSLILSSKLPEAKKFRHWVTSEVLPQIRRTGGYNLPQTLPEALRAYALEIEAKEKLAAENKLLMEKNAELEPKGEFFDTVTQSSDTISIGEVAQVLNMGMGRNKLFAFLRKKEILKRDNTPYQKYIDQGFFEIVEERYDKAAGDSGIYLKTVVRQKGLDYIRRRIKEEMQ